jgi:putative pyruvate formate lyase activating enzyme
MRQTMAATQGVDRFRLDGVEPAYRALHRDGRPAARVAEARRALATCRLCPRGCEARRLEGGTGTSGVGEESASVSGWLAREVSRDTYVNVMGQYRPAWRVGEPHGEGRLLLVEVDRRPRSREIEAAGESGRRAGLWRFDERRRAGREAWS